MKLLYVSNHRFIKTKNGEFYTTGQMGESYFSRFDEFFDQVTVIGLYEDESDNNTSKMIEKVNTNLRHLNFIFIKSSGKLLGRIGAISKIRKKYLELLPLYDRVATKAPSLIANSAVSIANSKNKPIIVEMVGCPWDAYWYHSLKGKIMAPGIWFITKKALKTAPYVVYVTNEFLQTRYPTLGETTNCSNVNITHFNQQIIENRLDKINDLQRKEKVIIGTIGAVNVRYKGQEYIIEAISKLKKQGNTFFEYQLVGGGDQNYLRAIAEKYNVSDQIKFLGPLPHGDIFNWLDNIDLYAQPSLTEGLPRALIEAMSRGLPAIGTDVGGIPELLESKYIFSNSNKRVNEITSILEGLRIDDCILQARQNFNKSKEYDRKYIERRRKIFLKNFISEN